jgi:hypothetical protein
MREKIKKDEVTVGSLDVKALYPSLEKEESIEIVKEEVENSVVDIEASIEEMTRYLPVYMTEDELRKEGLEEVVYREKKNGGKSKVKITDGVMTGGEVVRGRFKEMFQEPIRKPNRKEVKRMTALSIKIGVREVMGNNLYLFNRQVRRQKNGGPIGVELTGAVSRVVMGRWDRLFRNLMMELKMIMWLYRRYVDDMNLAVKTERTLKLVERKIVKKTEQEMEEERNENDDKVTMELIKNIADEVNGMIKTEADFPSNHNTGLLPILDLQVEIESSKEAPGIAQLSWQFYRKPMAPTRTILANSAMPMSMKRTTATQEVLRRLLNCKRDIQQETIQKHLNEYMKMLKRSGYKERFRVEVLRGGEEAYRRLLEKEEREERPLYRRKEDNSLHRWKAKRQKKGTWQGEFSSVVFIPHTRGSVLKERMQKAEEQMRVGGRENHRIKIIERAGRTLAGTLVRKNPFNKRECLEKKCFPCRSKEEGDKEDRISCRTNNIGYTLECKICEKKGSEKTEYIGESGQNGITRGRVHKRDFESKSEKVLEGSAMYKHVISKHKEEYETGKKEGRTEAEHYFRMRVIRKYKAPLDRQADEGTNMAFAKGSIINSKMQWHQPKLTRTVVVRGGAEILQNVVT